MINLLIIDDHPLVAGGIEMMIRGVENIAIKGIAKNGADALSFLEKIKPEIILLDINLPDTDGLQLCKKIRVTNLYSKIIALTSANDASIIIQLLQTGANGYLLKNMDQYELIEAIDKVMQGDIYLSKSANQKVQEYYSSVSTTPLDTLPTLTRREKEVLRLLADGMNGPQISEKLFLSHFTIETHRKNIMQKLNANSTQQLLKTARDNKLI